VKRLRIPESLTQSLLSLDSRWLFLTTFLVLSIPLLFPMKLPMAVTRETRRLYDTIQSLKPGEIAFLISSWDAGSQAENRPQATAIFEHLMRKNIPFLVFSTTDKGPQFSEPILRKLAERNHKVYGKDWVNLGFLPTDATTVQAIARDFHRMFPKDFYGTPTSEIPLMQKVKDMHDIALLVDIEYQPSEDWIKFVNGPYGTPTAFAVASIVSTTLYPYFATKQLIGLVVGPRGAAEYETLLGSPGEGYRRVLPLGFAPLIILFFTLIGNLAFYAHRRGQKRSAE